MVGAQTTVFPRYVWFQGRVVKSTQARVSVFDRGLLYGDGLFETLRSYDGRIFALREHLVRMRRSARALGYRVPLLDWEAGLTKLLAANRLADASIRITLTRGAAPPGLLPPARCDPSVFAFALPLPSSLVRNQQRGISVISVPFSRLPAFAAFKLLDYVPALMARREAAKRKAQEALYTSQGYVQEATTANVFWVTNRVLKTPPLNGPLPGVTRELVLRLARGLGMAVAESRLAVEELAEVDELFLTSSVVEVLPVVRVDGRRVGEGVPGPFTRALQRAYRQFVDQTLQIRR